MNGYCFHLVLSISDCSNDAVAVAFKGVDPLGEPGCHCSGILLDNKTSSRSLELQYADDSILCILFSDCLGENAVN